MEILSSRESDIAASFDSLQVIANASMASSLPYLRYKLMKAGLKDSAHASPGESTGGNKGHSEAI